MCLDGLTSWNLGSGARNPLQVTWRSAHAGPTVLSCGFFCCRAADWWDILIYAAQRHRSTSSCAPIALESAGTWQLEGGQPDTVQAHW